MTLNSFLFQALNGLSAASALFLVSVGLSLIFGVMRLVNIAHGDLIVLAAYVALVTVQTLGINPHTVLRGYQQLRDEGLIELHRGRGAVVVVRIGGRAALAGAVHDLVDEAKLHDLPESALLALVSEAYRSSPSAGVLRAGPTR